MTRERLTIGRWGCIASLIVAATLLSEPTKADAAGATWTQGHRNILVIPVRFTDAAGPTNSDPNGFTGWDKFTNGTITAAISNFFLTQSYNQFTVGFTILPVIDLGVPTTYYTNICPGTPDPKWTAWGAPGSLADDARTKARAIGLTNGMAALYESANYDLDIIATGYIPGKSGAASDGGRTVLTHNYFTAIPHELCHCLGLQHANGYSRASYYSPVQSGSYFYQAYGDVYCLMGWKENTRSASPPPDRDINAYFKYELGWLPTNYIVTPDASGLYRIHAFDQGSLNEGANYAMRIARDSSHIYWYDFRQAITNWPDSKWSLNGLEIHFGAEFPRSSSGTTVLWDMTPGSRGPTGTTFSTMHDAPLQMGRTFTDAEANLHVTPIKKGGTTPESLDVMVNFGPFPSNQAPTLTISPATVSLSSNVAQIFTATASDPDGDPLAYYWEFDDNTSSGGTDFGGLNADSRLATNGLHAWTQKGTNFVRCTVTDMKGHTLTASATVTVTNGSLAPFIISGVIKDELGNPLEGALVNNFRSGVPYGATNFAGSSATAADGKYQIAVPLNHATYKLTALYKGYSFTNSLGGTVTVNNASVPNVNFTRVRTQRVISGNVYLAGHGYNSATYGDVWVSDGTQSALVTNGVWQLNEDDGTLVTLTATTTNPTYTISSDFPKPYSVVDNVNTLHFFIDIPGAMPLTGFLSNGTQSADNVGTVMIPVTMTLPAGVTNWGGNQVFSLRIDPSSTAKYGVDYKMNEALITFYGALAPLPFLIPFTVIHDSVPKLKTVVLTLAPGSSVANLGPISTYTYTILNPMPPIFIRAGTNQTLELTWESNPSAHYTIESTPTVSPTTWSNLPPFTNLQTTGGSITQHIDLGTMSPTLFRVKVE